NSTLWYHTGQLGADGEITWSDSHQYDNGVLPTVAFTDAAGTSLREIHKSQSNDQNWQWRGVPNPGAGADTWSANAKTSDPRPNKSISSPGSLWVRVRSTADGSPSAHTL